jgi:hypothetical protein
MDEHIHGAEVLLVALERSGKEEVGQWGEVSALWHVAVLGSDEGQQL